MRKHQCRCFEIAWDVMIRLLSDISWWSWISHHTVYLCINYFTVSLYSPHGSKLSAIRAAQGIVGGMRQNSVHLYRPCEPSSHGELSSVHCRVYLKQISNARCRNALTKLRVSSHSLSIERGRHLGTAIQERLCTVCNAIEDEKHFLFECCINEELRFIFSSRVNQLYPQYQYLDSDQKLVFLFKIGNEQLITWVGKFVYSSFCLREEYHGKGG